MKSSVCFVVFFLASVFLGSSESAVVFRFANVYGDHMVLQQEPHRARIWGYGEVGQKVFLTIDVDKYQCGIKQGPNNTGIWSVTLKPHRYGGPYTIEASSVVKSTKVTATLKDALFGDVWICAGQSNMEMGVRTSTNGEHAILEAKHYHDIRLFTAGWSTSKTPQPELKEIRQLWSVSSPESVGGAGNMWNAYFSGTCWYYGIHLYQKLKYPIGLVDSSGSGTPVESWSSPDALKKCRINKNVLTPLGLEAISKVTGPEGLKPSRVWNAMMYPFTKMTIYGAIWYQGETNAHLGLNHYNCTFPAMIDDWRAKWFKGTQGNTDEVFPFGFVQLSSAGHNTSSQEYKFAPFRWDQTAHYGYVPNDRQKRVFMAVAMDLGNPYSPFHSLHPTNKNDVGKRLALASLAVAYGKNVYFTGPLVSEIKQIKEHSLNCLKVTFRSVLYKIEVRCRDGFEVLCEKSSQWIRAKIVEVDPESVIIRPSTDCKFEAVRYAWSDYPCIMKKCAVYSGKLPSPTFIKYGPFEKNNHFEENGHWLSYI